MKRAFSWSKLLNGGGNKSTCLNCDVRSDICHCPATHRPGRVEDRGIHASDGHSLKRDVVIKHLEHIVNEPLKVGRIVFGEIVGRRHDHDVPGVFPEVRYHILVFRGADSWRDHERRGEFPPRPVKWVELREIVGRHGPEHARRDERLNVVYDRLLEILSEGVTHWLA